MGTTLQVGTASGMIDEREYYIIATRHKEE